MKWTTTSIRTALAVMATTFALGSTAQATALRTFVSALGNDSNTASNCPRTSPCRTFANAYTVTSSGGEIVALDAGGYGSISITTPLTLTGTAGASISVGAAGTGITVGAGAGVVIVSNIQITGSGVANTKGVVVNSGRLILQDSGLTLLTTALTVNSSKVDINDTTFLGNTTAISTTGQGADAGNFPATGGVTQVRVAGGKVLDNTNAFVMNDPGLRPSATDNRISIFLYNQSGGYTTVVAGNTTVISGTGTSCTAQCTGIAQYQTSIANNNQN